MPRSNQYFDNLTETPILSENEAIDVLQEYCDEHDINPILLPNQVLQDFISTVQYAPHTIETDEIARRTGLANHRPDRPRRPMTAPYFTISNVTNDTSELRTVQSRPSVGRSIYSDIAIDAVREIMEANEARHASTNPFLTAQSPSVTMDTAEAIREETDDFLDMTGLAWSSHPKKKKRKRSDYDMAKEIVRGENFPRPNFRDFTSEREYEDIVNNWYSNVEYKERWIFNRTEREGFNRRNIGFFSLDDVMARMSKRKKAHPLDSSFSKFYDWKLGGTDWVLRLELFQHEQYYFLITRHIHKPTDTEIKFDVRYWSNERFKEINSVWCQLKNNDTQFDRVFGSNDENSPYYVRPYDEDEDSSYEWMDNEDDYEECEDSDF